MSSITDPKIRAFSQEGTRTGKLSFKRSGAPAELVVRPRPATIISASDGTD